MTNTHFEVSGKIIDLFENRIFPGVVRGKNGIIQSIEERSSANDQLILPGLIDAHIHIESSMLVPTEFARLAVTHGTVAAVCDPHEIANVMGLPGVEFMYNNGRQSPFKFFFGAPSCVPATPFETAGAVLDLKDIENLFARYGFKFLSEMMNVPGVLMELPEVTAKLELARKYGRPVDGHAPELRGDDLAKYVAAGISTDHECVSLAEAREKISQGMKVQIREGSAAKNFDELYQLVDEFPEMCMLCSDDKHPDDLAGGHINELVQRGLHNGLDKFNLLRAASVNPVEHYGLEVGLLRTGDPADFVIIDNFEQFNILQTWIDGQMVARNGQTRLLPVNVQPVNKFDCLPKEVADFIVPAAGEKIRVIELIPGQLVTGSSIAFPKVKGGNCVADVENDILKLTVVNRYSDTPPALGFVRGFDIKSGALASSVAHDSHNIVAVGTSDESICKAVNSIIAEQGGVAVVADDKAIVLPLPVAGVMSTDDGYQIGEQYAALDRIVKKSGSKLAAPFMSLSFLALLVIPRLKLSDRGLFDGDNFEFTSIFV